MMDATANKPHAKRAPPPHPREARTRQRRVLEESMSEQEKETASEKDTASKEHPYSESEAEAIEGKRADNLAEISHQHPSDKVNAMDEVGQHEVTIRAKAISDEISLLNECHEKREAPMNIETDEFIGNKHNEEKRQISEESRIEHQYKITENAIAGKGHRAPSRK